MVVGLVPRGGAFQFCFPWLFPSPLSQTCSLRSAFLQVLTPPALPPGTSLPARWDLGHSCISLSFALENPDSGFLPKGRGKHLGTLSADDRRGSLSEHELKTSTLGEHMVLIKAWAFLNLILRFLSHLGWKSNFLLWRDNFFLEIVV